jgi:hypothetical protein
MMASHVSFGDRRRRHRRQVLWRLARLLLAVMVVFGVGSYAYEVGVSATQARTEKLEADLDRFQSANLDLRDQLSLIRQRSDEAEQALDELRRRYAAEVPSGELAALLAEVDAQLTAGVEPERLAFLIGAAALDEVCAGEPEVKRFMPRTPITTGPVSYVRFADRITVTGAGESARNADNLAEAWYDPAAPIRLDFQTLDGAISSIEGALPLTHKMVVDGKEYRFSVVASERRFVEVAAQACALPQAADDRSAAAEGAGVDPSVAPVEDDLTD